jgi:hypothetical protein
LQSIESLPGRVAIGGIAAAAALLGGTGIASAATVPQAGARVVSFAAPADHALLRSTTVPVRIKAGSQVTGVKVFAGTKDISARFTRRGGAFTARIPRSMFKAGTTTLLVQAKAAGGKPGGAASVAVVVPGSGATSMRTSSGAKAAALTSAYQPTAGQVPVAITTKTPTYARLTVNGRRVSDLRASRASTVHDWFVSARDGLKVGRNAFVAESWDNAGRRSVKRWTVSRDGSLPLAEAGPHERVVSPDALTTLDATKSRATQKGGKLTYTWRVVRAPKGSTPQLHNANAAKPQFTAHQPGVYQVALRATQSTPGAHAAAAAGASEDVVTLDVVPPLSARGLYVDTGYFGADATNKDAGPYNTLYIEGQPFSASFNGQPDTFVQLDEATLAVKAWGNHTQISPAANTITIGAWTNTNIPNITGAWGSAMWIGTQQVAYNATDDDPGAGSGNPTSNLHGWLKPASGAGVDDATWIDSDMLQVKTREPDDTPTTNTMEINGQTYQQTLGSGQTGGWHLMVLNNSAHVVANTLYPNGQEDQLASALSGVGFGYTILLQAFGTVPAVPSSTNLGNVIQNLGGRTDVVDRFNGKADSTGGVYALVTGASKTANNKWSGYAASEASFERTGTSGTVTGLLMRDATQNDYVPLTSDTAAPDATGGNRYGFLPLIYAPPTDWTNWIRDGKTTLRAPTTAEAAAYADLLTAVQNSSWAPASNLCSDAPDTIRGQYCNTDATQLSNFDARIDGLRFDPTVAGGRYQSSDWNTVVTSIDDEILDVSDIRAKIANYQALFGQTKIAGIVNAQTISDAIKASITKSTTVQTDADEENILGALTDMASVIPEIGPEMTFMSGAFSLMADLEPNTNPQDVLDQVQVTSDTAAATLVSSMQTASTQLSTYADYMVDDPVKLMQGASYLRNNDPETTQNNLKFQLAGEYATQQWLWGTMLSKDYSVWVVPRVFGYSPTCSDKSEHFGDPWASYAPNGNNGTWISSIGVGAANQSSHWLLGYDSDTKTPSDNWSWSIPNKQFLNDGSLPSSITDPLFGLPVSSTNAPSVTTNAGAIAPYFQLDYFSIKFPPQMPQSAWSQNPNKNGCEPHAGIPSTLP